MYTSKLTGGGAIPALRRGTSPTLENLFLKWRRARPALGTRRLARVPRGCGGACAVAVVTRAGRGRRPGRAALRRRWAASPGQWRGRGAGPAPCAVGSRSGEGGGDSPGLCPAPGAPQAARPGKMETETGRHRSCRRCERSLGARL